MRRCLVCGAWLHPAPGITMTAHEYDCFKTHPNKVPDRLWKQFTETRRWELRSAAAKRGAVTRRRRKAAQLKESHHGK